MIKDEKSHIKHGENIYKSIAKHDEKLMVISYWLSGKTEFLEEENYPD